MKGLVRTWATFLCVTMLLGVAPMPPAAGNDAAALDQLADKYWQRRLETDYFLREQLGKPVEKIQPLTYGNADADASFAQGILDGLKAIDPTKLDHDRWLTYRTLQYLSTNDVAYRTYFWLRQQATPYAGGSQIAVIASIFGGYDFANAADAARYESLLHQYATFVQSMGELLKGQHQRGIVLPNVETDASAAVFEGYAKAGAERRADSSRVALAVADAGTAQRTPRYGAEDRERRGRAGLRVGGNLSKGAVSSRCAEWCGAVAVSRRRGILSQSRG